jgi:cobalt-zinc-cadmium efflux system membrane fusion protein
MTLPSQARFIAVLMIALTASLASGHEGHQPLPTKGVQVDTQNGQLTLSAQSRDAIGLQAEELVVGTVASTLTVYAEAATPWQAKAFGSAQISGRIAKLLSRPGDFVKKDQIIAELSSRELELLKLDYQQAVNDLSLNQRLLDMTRPTALAGAVPMQRLLEIENAVEQSQNRVEVARIRARTLGVSPDAFQNSASGSLNYPIRSPIAGQILHSDLAEGKYVEALEHLFEVVNTDEVWVRLQLLEKDIFKAKVGNRVKVEFPASSISVEGVIDRMDAGLNPQTQVSSAWMTLANQSIIPGLVGRGTIYTSEQDEKLTVPRRAVYSDGLQNYVFVEEASTRTSAEYRKKTIQLGKRTLEAHEQIEPMVEVLQGDIYPGDRVVVKGGHELSSLFFLGVLKLSSSDQQRLGIRTEPASHREVALTTQLTASVTLPPENRSVLSSQLDGTVYSHNLNPGRSVEAGEILMEIASPEFHKLQLDLISTSLDADLSLRRADRLDGVKGDAVSLRIVLETRSEADQLKARAESLRRQLSTLGLLESEIESIVKERRILDYLPLRSNIAGRITSSVVTLGETVAASQPLVEIHNLESVWIEAHVRSHETHSLHGEVNGIATILANPEIRFPVVVSRIGSTVNESTRTQRIWLTPIATSSSPQLRSGALITVVLPIGSPTSNLAIPSSAILREGMHYFSFVQKDDGYVDRRRLKIGRSDGAYTEIVDGIEVGELVVTAGGRELQTAFASLR